MKVRCVKVGPIQTNCYIVEDDGQGKKPFCAVIDPGDDAQFITGLLDREPSHIIITHCHFDHIGALKALKRIFPDAVIAVGEHENHDPEHIAEIAVSALGSFFYRYGMSDSFNGFPEPDVLLKDGDEIGPFTVLHTPGHTSGSICLYSEKDKVLFSGDTLFRHSYGRTDLGGDENQIMQSLKRLLRLDPETTVYPGHEESTLISDERSYFNF